MITDFQSFVDLVLEILGLIVPIIFALALLFFFWGIAQFILSAGDAQKRQEGKQILVWGIIILFVMFSIWAIVQLLLSTFDF